MQPETDQVKAHGGASGGPGIALVARPAQEAKETCSRFDKLYQPALLDGSVRSGTLLLALLSLLSFLALAPAAEAHGLVNAGELETLIVEDEASDVVTGLDLGFDLVQLYVGEAHVPGVGDGFYVHTILYGGAGDRPALDGPMGVRFEFGFGEQGFARLLESEDGQTFTSDFDALTVIPGDGEVEVQRAFVAYPKGFGPGSVLTSLRAISLVNDEPRDVAPGGVFLPGARTEVEMGDSAQVVESYTLKGPVGYLSQVEVIAMTDGGGEFLVTAWTGLKTGSQHIMMTAEPSNGWTAHVEGPGGETTPGENQIFSVHLTPGEGPYTFDLYTDIGGHVQLTAEQTEEGVRLATPESAAVQPAAGERESPAPAWLALGALALVLLARKAQR